MGLLRNFLADNAGNMSVIFAVSAVPLMLIASVAMDVSYAERTDNNLQNALDRAALAAVANPNLNAAERQLFAQKVFNDNFVSKHKASLSFPTESNSAIFSIEGEVSIPTTLGAIANMKSLAVDATSTAILEEEGSICVLSLAPDGPNRVRFSDNATFNAPNCTVQVNSSDAGALLNAGTTIPKAAGFCAVGSGSGQFEPLLNSECRPVSDPYENLTPPADAPCLSFSNGGALFSQVNLFLNTPGRGRSLGQDLGLVPSGVDSENGTGSNVTMRPGLYCGGLTVDGIDVQFLPGTYIIRGGNLTFKNISQAEALGVTFVLQDNATVNIELGAQLRVKAPKDGNYAGIAFYQVPPTPQDDEIITFPTAASSLSSGGQLDVEGTLYFPSQSLEISGDSFFGSQAKATSFIAYEIDFSGEAISMVSVDYRAANLPPLEPRTTGGPRLIK